MARTVAHSIRPLMCAFLLLAATVADLAAQGPQPDVGQSPALARTLSALGTAVPLALGFLDGNGLKVSDEVVGGAGLVFGPTVGYLYAGAPERGLRRAIPRALVLGIAGGSAALLCAHADCSFNMLGPTGGAFAPAALLVAAGAVVTTVLAVKDIGRVGSVVEVGDRPSRAFSVRPAYFAAYHRTGVLLTWRR